MACTSGSAPVLGSQMYVCCLPDSLAMPPLPQLGKLKFPTSHPTACVFGFCPAQALRGVRALRGGLSLATSSSLAAALTLAVLQTLLLGSGAAAAPPLFPPPPPFLPRAPLPGPISGSAPFALLAAGLACALLDQSLGQLERRFLFTDYEHHNK